MTFDPLSPAIVSEANAVMEQNGNACDEAVGPCMLKIVTALEEVLINHEKRIIAMERKLKSCCTRGVNKCDDVIEGLRTKLRICMESGQCDIDSILGKAKQDLIACQQALVPLPGPPYPPGYIGVPVTAPVPLPVPIVPLPPWSSPTTPEKPVVETCKPGKDMPMDGSCPAPREALCYDWAMFLCRLDMIVDALLSIRDRLPHPHAPQDDEVPPSIDKRQGAAPPRINPSAADEPVRLANGSPVYDTSIVEALRRARAGR